MASIVERGIAKLSGKEKAAVKRKVDAGDRAVAQLKEKKSATGIMMEGIPTIGGAAAVGFLESNVADASGKVAGVPVDLGAALVFTGLGIGSGSPAFTRMAVGAASVAAYNAAKNANISLPGIGGRGASAAGAASEEG
jgi:hypothetical protein